MTLRSASVALTARGAEPLKLKKTSASEARQRRRRGEERLALAGGRRIVSGPSVPKPGATVSESIRGTWRGTVKPGVPPKC